MKLPVITAEMWDRILNGTPNQNRSPSSASGATSHLRNADAKETAPTSNLQQLKHAKETTPASNLQQLKPTLGDTINMKSITNGSPDGHRRRMSSRSSSLSLVSSSPSSRASSPEVSLLEQTGDRKHGDSLISSTGDSKKRKRYLSNAELDQLRTISTTTIYGSGSPHFQLEDEPKLNDAETTNFKVFLAVHWDMNEQTIVRCCQRYQRFASDMILRSRNQFTFSPLSTFLRKITSTLMDYSRLTKQYFSDYRAIRRKVLELKREAGAHLSYPDKVLQRCDGCYGSTPSLNRFSLPTRSVPQWS